MLNGNHVEINSCNTKVLPEGDSVVIIENESVIDNVVHSSEL